MSPFEIQPAAQPLVTFIIATRNRAGELVHTLESCLEQRWPHKEILVVDDASGDGTFELVRERFPMVDIVRNPVNKGSIASRNDLLQRARGKYVVGLDDDSRLIDPDACARLVERMEAEPDLGIVALQAIGPEHPERLTEEGRLRGEWHAGSFAFCGVALRRAMLEKTGFLPELFYHAYEEPDLALRAWDAGYRVLQWNEVCVYHEYSPQNRAEQRTHRRHARNEALSAVMRAPWPLVPPLVAARLVAQARYAARRGWLAREPHVWAETLWRLPQALRQRRPVSAAALKIVLGLNRRRVADAHEAWALGHLGWSEVLYTSPASAGALRRTWLRSANRLVSAARASAARHPD